jgi:hypothetical protein
MERLEVRQFLEQVQVSKPELPDGLIDRLIQMLDQESPGRLEDIKALFREYCRG